MPDQRIILVVDDEELMRIALTRALETLDGGIAVVEADNPSSALALADRLHPDLIISDVVMGNGTGNLLRHLLRSNPLTASIPVIMMSGYADETVEWGSDPEVLYLKKPFSAAILLDTVKQMIA